MEYVIHICFKIARAVMIIIMLISVVAIFGLVGKIETTESPLSAYTPQIIGWCFAAVTSFGFAKLADYFVKRW